jgi:hypothetical protein
VVVVVVDMVVHDGDSSDWFSGRLESSSVAWLTAFCEFWEGLVSGDTSNTMVEGSATVGVVKDDWDEVTVGLSTIWPSCSSWFRSVTKKLFSGSSDRMTVSEELAWLS